MIRLVCLTLLLLDVVSRVETGSSMTEKINDRQQRTLTKLITLNKKRKDGYIIWRKVLGGRMMTTRQNGRKKWGIEAKGVKAELKKMNSLRLFSVTSSAERKTKEQPP